MLVTLLHYAPTFVHRNNRHKVISDDNRLSSHSSAKLHRAIADFRVMVDPHAADIGTSSPTIVARAESGCNKRMLSAEAPVRSIASPRTVGVQFRFIFHTKRLARDNVRVLRRGIVCRNAPSITIRDLYQMRSV